MPVSYKGPLMSMETKYGERNSEFKKGASCDDAKKDRMETLAAAFKCTRNAALYAKRAEALMGTPHIR